MGQRRDVPLPHLTKTLYAATPLVLHNFDRFLDERGESGGLESGGWFRTLEQRHSQAKQMLGDTLMVRSHQMMMV